MVKTSQHRIENPLGGAFEVWVSGPESAQESRKVPLSMILGTGEDPSKQSLQAYVYAIPTATDVLSTMIVDTADDTVRETTTRIAKLCARKVQRPCYVGVAGNGNSTLSADQLLLCKECVRVATECIA